MKIFRHSLYNLLGLGLPLIVAIFCIPVLIQELGEARFGLLTLIWAVVSYFGLFDLGLGRALTQLLAVALAENDYKRVGSLVATAIIVMGLLGIFAGLLMVLLAPWGVGLIQSVPDPQETINAVLLMAIAMPTIILTSGFRGVLEARHAFGIINVIRLPMGLYTFLAPVFVVIYVSPRLDLITGALAVGRLIACGVHAFYAWRVLPDLHGRLAFKKTLLKPLCTTGGWMMVSNVISPFMGYVDRFMVGAIISATAVAYYTAPQEIVTKLWIIPGALTAVLFPTFATQASNGFEGTRKLFNTSIRWIYSILLPITVFLAIFAFEILSFWIGSDFAYESYVLLQIFSLGIFLNCITHVPFTLIQGAGAPRITALIQVAELPFFLFALWWLVSTYGLIGAAIAWLLRTVIDMFLMFLFCNHLQRWPLMQLINYRTIMFSLIACLAFSGVMFERLGIRFSFAILIAIVSALILFSPRLIYMIGKKA
jgi:O-antigen/teichoic acid export membrane protein